MDIAHETVSLTISYADGFIRYIPNVSAFLVRHRIPMRHPQRFFRPVCVIVEGDISEECKKYLSIRLNPTLLDPFNGKFILFV